jgi:hypothetical protein
MTPNPWAKSTDPSTEGSVSSEKLGPPEADPGRRFTRHLVAMTELVKEMEAVPKPLSNPEMNQLSAILMMVRCRLAALALKSGADQKYMERYVTIDCTPLPTLSTLFLDALVKD